MLRCVRLSVCLYRAHSSTTVHFRAAVTKYRTLMEENSYSTLDTTRIHCSAGHRKWLKRQRSCNRRRFRSFRQVAAPSIRPRRTATGGHVVSLLDTLCAECIFSVGKGGTTFRQMIKRVHEAKKVATHCTSHQLHKISLFSCTSLEWLFFTHLRYTTND